MVFVDNVMLQGPRKGGFTGPLLSTVAIIMQSYPYKTFPKCRISIICGCNAPMSPNVTRALTHQVLKKCIQVHRLKTYQIYHPNCSYPSIEIPN